MNFYVLASFKTEADEKSIRELTVLLNECIRRYSPEGYFLNVTSSDASFLNDARRLVKGDSSPVFNPSFSTGRAKKSRGR